MSCNISKSILATLAYYDVMDFPLTGFEIWKYLIKVNGQEIDPAERSLENVWQKLEDRHIRHFIDEYRGFYFLKGRQSLVASRLERNKISQKKLKIARKSLKWLRLVPFVRMIAITGSVAKKNPEKNSDIDFLVVIRESKIFTGRLLVSLVIQLLGLRRRKNKIQDKICLNYFITTQSLEINLKDMFAASEYSFMLPVYGYELFCKFVKKNRWLANHRLNYSVNQLRNLIIMLDNKFTRAVRRAGEKILQPAFLENRLKKWQIRKIMNNPKTSQKGSIIIANDEMLVFLPEPQSPHIYEKFQNNLSRLALNKAALD